MRPRIACAITLLVLLAPASFARADGELDANRERFRAGLEKYKAGQFADAIVVWEDILKDIGTTTGYRLAFNLGRAYEAFGSPTRAAERYELFLNEATARRKEGVALEPQVEEQLTQAQGRLQELSQTLARIRTEPTAPPTLVQIDLDAPRVSGFLAYVQPGRHRIRQSRGDVEAASEVECVAGKIVILPSLPPPRPRVAPEPRPAPPISATWIYVTAGGAVLSLALPVYLYTHALSIRADYLGATDADKVQLAADYESARTLAYGSWIVPATLAAAAGGLAAYYTFGKREPVAPVEVRVNAAGASLQFRY